MYKYNVLPILAIMYIGYLYCAVHAVHGCRLRLRSMSPLPKRNISFVE